MLLAAVSATPAEAAVRHEWVAAVPTTWNIVPNGRDGIMGTTFDPSQTVFPTVVYRRYTKNWRRPLRNAPVANVDHDMIPGPLLHARVGDRLRIHFKNKDPNNPHSMHFHGVHYRPSSDGSYIPGFSGPGGNVKPGRSFTYRLNAGGDSAGVWPYHDHSPSMHDSLAGGLWGALSIRGRHERRPDREFVTVFAPMKDFQTINGRAFVGQHADLPLEGGRPRPVGRARDRRRAPHLPRPRPSLAHGRRRAGGHAHPRARRRASACPGARTLRAHGSTTATWSSTWRRA